jgi:ubiquinone/menaquinone biosynthesis C-methylase UbiE
MNSMTRTVVTALHALRRQLLGQQWFTSTVLPAIPRPVRWMLRKLYFLPSDLIDRLFRRREEMIPPKSLIFTGSVDDFKSSGEALVQRLVNFGDLTPDSKVLDIGCGMGRLAVALTGYLNANGSYEGFDIVPSGIKWCNDNIASRYSNFHFTLADVYNKEYHPGGRLEPSEYRFPYADETFDLVALASVFTHMLPADMEHYIAEISRVLKKGGRCYASYSLVNAESLQGMESSRSSLRFKRHAGPSWVVDTKVPELAVGYDEPYVRDLYEHHGLSGRCNVYYGSWSGRQFDGEQSGFSQDIVVTAKR